MTGPDAALDQAITNLHGGANVTDDTLKGWTEGENYELTSITRNGDGVITSATAKWPDGTSGTFTATTVNGTWLGIDAYTVTHAASGKIVTQTVVTRNADGDVTSKPALTVS